MQVSPGGIFSPEYSSDVHNVPLFDSVFKIRRLICPFFLSASNFSFEALRGSNSYTFGQTSALVGVCSNVSPACLICHLSRGSGIVASKDLVCPLGLLQLLRLDVGYEDGSFLFLALGVIEF